MKKRLLGIIAMLLTGLFVNAKNPQNYYANKAEESRSVGRYEDAIDYARQEIIDYENNPNGYFQASLSYYALQQPGQSLSMINKAIDKSKKDKNLSVKCYMTKSTILQEMGDTIQAVQALADGLKRNPKNYDLLIEHARLLSSIDSKKALSDLQKAKKLDPTEPRSYLYTAYLYTTDGKYKDALDEITKAISLDSTMPYSYALRGKILQHLGYSPDWIKDCLHSIELERDPYAGLGIILLAGTESSKDRLAVLKEIDDVKARNKVFHQLQADLLYEWGQYSDAAKCYDELIKSGLTESKNYYFLADCQNRLGHIIDAYTTASMGLDKYPDELTLQYLKAQIGVLAGKGAEVLGILNSLISQSPENDAFYVEKGKALMSLGRYSDAVEPFATAVMLSSNVLNKMYYGDALRLSGNTLKADSEYNDILRKTEDEITKEGQLPQYVYAMAFSGLGNKDRAISSIKLFVKDNPSAETQFLPSVYSRLGLKSEAIAALKAYTAENKWNALFDLYSYNFHILHPEASFAELLSDHGVKTTFNETTKLLEHIPDNIFTTAGVSSLEDAKDILADNPSDWLEAINKLCPIDIGLGGKIVSVDFEEKSRTVQYNCVISPLVFNFNLTNGNALYKKKKEDVFALGFLSNNPKIANLGLTTIYHIKASDNSGESDLIISPARIKDLKMKMQSQDEIDKLMLDFWLEEDSLMIPDNPMAPDAAVELDGSILTYTYPMPEDDGTMSRIELFKSDVKDQLSNLIKDASMQNRLPVYIRQDITLRFIYKGKTTGKCIDFVFTPEELTTYLQKEYE